MSAQVYAATKEPDYDVVDPDYDQAADPDYDEVTQASSTEGADLGYGADFADPRRRRRSQSRVLQAQPGVMSALPHLISMPPSRRQRRKRRRRLWLALVALGVLLAVALGIWW